MQWRCQNGNDPLLMIVLYVCIHTEPVVQTIWMLPLLPVRFVVGTALRFRGRRTPRAARTGG